MTKWLQQKYRQFGNKTFALVLIVSILEISGDSALSWTSPVLPKLHSNNSAINPLGRPLRPQEEAWLGSLLTIGALVGSFPFSLISDTYGRKFSLLLIALPNIISYITLAFSKNLIVYYIARFVLGIGVGAKCTLIPVYIVEIAEDSNRGMLTTTANIFATFGSLLSFTLGPYLSMQWFNLVLALIPILFLCLFLLFGLETPYFLINHNRHDLAEQVLQNLKDLTEISLKESIEKIESEINDAKNESGRLLDLFRSKTNLKSLTIALVLTISEQMSGLAAFVFYAEDIFSEVSLNVSSHIIPIIIGTVLFVSSFISPIFVDSWGRRPLLLTSFLGMTVANIILGAFFYLKTVLGDDKLVKYETVPLISMIFYIILMNIGVGSLMWSVACELFPPNLQSSALVIVGVTSWLTTFLVTNFYESIVSWMGKGQTFWLFAVWCAATFVFIVFYLPETKGKSFTQIRIDIKKL